MKGLIASLALLLTLTSCGRSAADQANVLHVGSQRGGTKALMLASGALDGATYNVEWSEFAAAQPLLEAIGSGAVDLGVTGDAPFMFAYQSGSPVRAIAAQYVKERPAGALALIVPGESGASSIVDLKNRKVATTRGSVGHHLVIRALARAGLPADWVQLTFLSPGDAKAAFSSGSIDAWATWAPYLLPALREGASTIIDGKDFVQGYGFAVAHSAAIETKRALLSDFLKREAKALAWARQHPDAYGEVLARETGLPIEVARDFALKIGRTAVPIDDRVIADQARVLDDFRAAGAVKGDKPIAAGFDRAFADTTAATAG